MTIEQALQWFVDHRPAIQAKFDLYGPTDTALAMHEAFAVAQAALTSRECTCPQHGNWINAKDVHKAARAIDVAMNGEAGAARQPALIDLVGQAEGTWKLLHLLAMTLATIAITSDYGKRMPVDLAIMLRNTLDLYYHRYPNQRIGQKYTTAQMADILKQMEAFDFGSVNLESGQHEK